MQELAPQQSRPSGNHPSDAELAAYIDGALGKEEATRVMEHLASCESCFEVYSETLRFQLDSKQAPPQGKIVPFPQKDPNPKPWAWAAAAVLMVGLSGVVYTALLGSPPGLSTAEVTRPIQGRKGLAESSWLGPTYRGSGDGEEAPLDPVSFQLGVQLVNLQVSLAANEGERSQDVVARILQLLESQVAVNDLQESYIEITRAISGGTPPLDLLKKATELANQTRAVMDAPHLDFGQWVEAGRLSAIAQEPAFFQQDENRSFLRRTIWRQRLGIGDMTIESSALQSLSEISKVVSKRVFTFADYAKLEQNFDIILEVYYPSSNRPRVDFRLGDSPLRGPRGTPSVEPPIP